jgi:hypothetical protein
MTKIKKSVANLLLLLHKPMKTPKVISLSDAMIALLLHRRLKYEILKCH